MPKATPIANHFKQTLAGLPRPAETPATITPKPIIAGDNSMIVMAGSPEAASHESDANATATRPAMPMPTTADKSAQTTTMERTQRISGVNAGLQEE